MEFIINILFLEDDVLLAQSVIDELEDSHYNVSWACESDEVFELTYGSKFDLYLFDVNVPGMNGFEILKSLRDSGDDTPTIFMTSRNQIDDLKEGFSAGACDYIKKPFDIDELLIRIESKLPPSKLVKYTKLFSLDPNEYKIYCLDNTTTLPLKEFKLLEYFIKYKSQLVETDSIINDVFESSITIATLRTYIKNLKRHIEGCGVIENVKGVGYRFKLL